MVVESVFVSMRPKVADDSTQMTNEVAVNEVRVNVYRYHPLYQGIMVEVTASDLLLSSCPFARSKFAKLVVSEKKAIYAK